MSRQSQVDSGRRGQNPMSHTKKMHGTVTPPPPAKGAWESADRD